MIATAVTMTTVVSRRETNQRTATAADDPRLAVRAGAGARDDGLAGAGTVVSATSTSEADGRRRLVSRLRRGAALVTRRVRHVRRDVGLGHETEAGVGVRRLHQPGRDLVQEELDRRDEPLQVGLLVDGEDQVARLHALQNRHADVPTRAADLALQVVL